MNRILSLLTLFFFSVVVSAADIKLNTRNLPANVVTEAQQKTAKVMDKLLLPNDSIRENIQIVITNRLNDKQVETIKDAMTYNLFHIRYDDFMDLLPNLTESDKNRVYHWLVEAREFSMDFETPRKMRQMFTKYRGRINNYLSSRGYDLRKATEEQEARKMKNK